MTETEPLLDEFTVADYLRGRGFGGGASPIQVRRLSGGVSNIVLGVEYADQRCVVKQSLPQLAVADEWFAPVDRVITEADALTRLAAITPDALPRVLDEDPAQHAITIEWAPEGWLDWKSLLLRREVRATIAARLGALLGEWHAATEGVEDAGERFDDYAAFESLRVDPYYRTVGRRVPEVSEQIDELIVTMSGRRLCIVHGDFSPKNVLTASADQGDGLWVIDFEVAHRGDPIFDVAFMCTHLILKSLALPRCRRAFDSCIREFLDAYLGALRRSGGTRLDVDFAHLSTHVGALVVSRVRGKSPVEYLDDETRAMALKLGIGLLNEPALDLDELLHRRDRVAE